MKHSQWCTVLAKGFMPGWPNSSYHFDCQGVSLKSVDINFYIGGISYPDQSFSPHVLEWDGKAFKDITTNVDHRRKVVTGRTDKPSIYVIMDATSIDKESGLAKPEN